MKKRVVVMGAAGRDFHNFLVFFKPQPEFDVVAFTAEQIPGIAGRTFPRPSPAAAIRTASRSTPRPSSTS